jgi:allophanate hydrolase subunit 2
MNRLVGNPRGAATIETMGAFVVEALRPVVVASSTDGHRQALMPGARLRVDAPADAIWAYLAVRGGFDIDPVLGSRSQDTLGGVGPPALAVDSMLSVGPDPGTRLDADHAPPRPSTNERIRLWEGPQHDWFVGGLECLTAGPWQVTNELSRVGVRLGRGEFTPSTRARATMPSIGLAEGAIQVTPAGEPIVMLANHPTTGGYPVLAVVEPDDLPALVQTRPGSTIRFRRA